MAIYSVYLPPESGNDAALSSSSAERIAFLSDDKALLALIVPVVWLIWQRLWLALAVYALVMVVIMVLAQSGYGTISSLLSVLPGIYLLIEGREMIRRRYERQGWNFDGVIEAGDEETAELRYFSKAEHRHSLQKSRQKPRPAAKPRMFATSQIRPAPPTPMGLFPE